jgi:hypothetical protein
VAGIGILIRISALINDHFLSEVFLKREIPRPNHF